MNPQLPSHDDIQAAFKRGGVDFVALFKKVRLQIIELAKQLLSKQAQIMIINGLQTMTAKNDDYKKATKIESLCKPRESNNGGQTEPTFIALNAVETPDHIETHDPSCWTCCHTLLDEVEVEWAEERQVYDIPAMKIEVTAHHVIFKKCPGCGTENKGDFPETITQPVQYGQGVILLP